MAMNDTWTWEQLELLGRLSDPPQSAVDVYFDIIEARKSIDEGESK